MARPIRPLGAASLALPLLLTAAGSTAGEPLWELGAGVGVLSIPHYRGSNQREIYALPLPYVVYRGDFLKIDRDRVRGVLYQGTNAEWDISLGVGVPVRSEDNNARRGMPDLDPTVEIGPQWSYRLRESYGDIRFRLPLRRVLAVDLPDVRDVGTVFAPTVALDRDHYPWPGWRASVSTGPVFGDRNYVAYYYGVDGRYATAERPEWTARSGYGGWQLTMTMTRRFEKLWFGAFVRADHVGGAAFEGSPLVRERLSWTGGIGISWIFFKSAQEVDSVR